MNAQESLFLLLVLAGVSDKFVIKGMNFKSECIFRKDTLNCVGYDKRMESRTYKSVEFSESGIFRVMET